MSISSTANSVLTQFVPNFSIRGPLTQNQILLFDTTCNAFVNVASNQFFSYLIKNYNSTLQYASYFLSTTGDGNQQTFILPWVAQSQQSIFVFVNGIKLNQNQYNYQVNSNTTNVTLSSIPGIGNTIEILGFALPNPLNIKISITPGNGTAIYTVPWIVNETGSIYASVNGVKIFTSQIAMNYVSNFSTTITLPSTVATNAVIEFIGFQGLPSSNFEIITIAGTGASSYTLPWNATNVDDLIITYNNQKLNVSQYSLTPINSVSSTLVLGFSLLNSHSLEVYSITGLDLPISNTISPLVQVNGVNLGSGSQVFNSSSVSNQISTMNFRSLIAGTGISLSSDPNTITINALISTPSNFIENIGSGSDILVSPVGSIAQLRSLVAGTGITLQQNSDNIQVSFDGTSATFGGLPATSYATTISTVGSGISLVNKGSASANKTFELFSVKAGEGIVLTNINDTIYISDANGGHYQHIVGDYAVVDEDYIVGVNSTAGAIHVSLPDTANLGPGRRLIIKDEGLQSASHFITVTAQGGQLIDGSGSQILQNNGGAFSYYTDGANWYTIGSAGGTGTITGAVNIGSGNGLFTSILSGNLQFKSLIAGTNITLTSASNSITINSANFSLEQLTDVSISAPATNQALVWNGSSWINGSVSTSHISGLATVATTGAYADLTGKPTLPVVERVIFKYTAGSAGNLSGVDSIVSNTSGIAITVVDGANSIVRFTFTGYKWPPTSIIAYGQVYSTNQFEIRTVANFSDTSSVFVSDTGSAAFPDIISGIATTPPITLQLRMSDTGASAGFGQRAQLLIQFLMTN